MYVYDTYAIYMLYLNIYIMYYIYYIYLYTYISISIYIYIYKYIYIYIYILHICNGFVATDRLGPITYKASVITGRARCFNDYTYIMPILLL